MALNIIDILRVTTAVIRLVERIFAKHKKAGPRKRAKAIRALTRILGKNGDVPPELAKIIGALIDLLGPQAHKALSDIDGFKRIADVWSTISDAADVLAPWLDDDEVLRAELTHMIDGEVDLPFIDGEVERVFFAMLVDLAVETARKHVSMPVIG
jgi:hypothetical protein